MIYVADELIKLNGVVLPGLVKSIEVIELLRVVLNNMFVSHAGGAWLDLKMACLLYTSRCV